MPHRSSLEWEQRYHELEARYLELETPFQLRSATTEAFDHYRNR